jgi:pyruvate dehydrogenase E1 component alpha subunit
MTLRTIEKFEVKYLQALDEHGNVDRKLMPKLSGKDIKRLYELLVLTRTFDDKCMKMQRQGRIGTYISSLGQEAATVASAFALNKKDWIFSSFREHGAYITMGYPIERYLLYWGWNEYGSHAPAGMNVLPVTIPVSTQLPHAAGAAFAAKLKKDRTVVVAYHGDGATSKGDWHEAMNFAGRFKLPLVVICQNNQWAISVPVKDQTASATLAQKAIAYGFEGIKIDGNDVFAVYKATKEAVDRARKGKGPTFIECETYRIADHSTSDDAAKYRSLKEVDSWKRKDPIQRLWTYMRKKKLWNKKYGEKVIADAAAKVESAVKKFEATKPQTVDEAFAFTYAEPTLALKEQLADAKSYLEWRKKNAKD